MYDPIDPELRLSLIAAYQADLRRVGRETRRRPTGRELRGTALRPLGHLLMAVGRRLAQETAETGASIAPAAPRC